MRKIYRWKAVWMENDIIYTGGKSNWGVHSVAPQTKWELNKWQNTKGAIQLCYNGFHCCRFLSYLVLWTQELPDDKYIYIAKVEVKGRNDILQDKEAWEYCRIVNVYSMLRLSDIKRSRVASKREGIKKHLRKIL